METSRRELIAGIGAAALAASVQGEANMKHRSKEPAEQTPWHRRTLVGIEIGPTGANDRDRIYMSKATGKDWVEALLRANCEYGVLFMKDMEFAYYNSRVARKCPNLGSRDILREALDAAKPHNLPIVAYCQVQYDDSSWRAHPDWRMKGWEDNDLGGRLCYNSGYIEFIKAVLAEMMEYEIVGFHVDMLDYGFGPPVGCWCPACKARFKEKHGADLPIGETWDELWDKVLAFRCESNSRFSQEVQAFVREKRPDISVDFNYHGYPPFSWYPGETPAIHAANGDFVTAEGLPWVFGHNTPSMLSVFLNGARADRRTQVATSRGVYDYHDFTVKPAAEIEWEVMTYLSHGVQCTIVDKLYYDGALEPVAYDRIGQAFSKARKKRDLFGHSPVAEVGLYYSHRTRDWWGRNDPPKYMRSFWGAHLAMMQAHTPMAVILDETVTLERLTEHPVVWLPGVTILSEAEVALLRKYVEGGGKLLITGLTGICDRYGRPQDRSSVMDLVGGKLTRCELQYNDNYLILPAAPESNAFARAIGADISAGLPLLVYGPMAIYEPTTAQAIGSLHPAYRSQNNLWVNHMSPGPAAGPAVLLNEIGKGQVITIPCAVDAGFVGDYRLIEHRALLRNAVRWLNPNPPVIIHAPANVETVVTRDERRKRLLVHFVAWNAPPTFSSVAFPTPKRVHPPVMEEPQTYSATVTLNVPVRSVSMVEQGSRVRRRGSEVTITSSAIHDVLVIRTD